MNVFIGTKNPLFKAHTTISTVGTTTIPALAYSASIYCLFARQTPAIATKILGFHRMDSSYPTDVTLQLSYKQREYIMLRKHRYKM